MPGRCVQLFPADGGPEFTFKFDPSKPQGTAEVQQPSALRPRATRRRAQYMMEGEEISKSPAIMHQDDEYGKKKNVGLTAFNPAARTPMKEVTPAPRITKLQARAHPDFSAQVAKIENPTACGPGPCSAQ